MTFKKKQMSFMSRRLISKGAARRLISKGAAPKSSKLRRHAVEGAYDGKALKRIDKGMPGEAEGRTVLSKPGGDRRCEGGEGRLSSINNVSSGIRSKHAGKMEAGGKDDGSGSSLTSDRRMMKKENHVNKSVEQNEQHNHRGGSTSRIVSNTDGAREAKRTKQNTDNKPNEDQHKGEKGKGGHQDRSSKDGGGGSRGTTEGGGGGRGIPWKGVWNPTVKSLTGAQRAPPPPPPHPSTELGRLKASQSLRSRLHRLCTAANLPRTPVLAFERWLARSSLSGRSTDPLLPSEAAGEHAYGLVGSSALRMRTPLVPLPPFMYTLHPLHTKWRESLTASHARTITQCRDLARAGMPEAKARQAAEELGKASEEACNRLAGMADDGRQVFVDTKGGVTRLALGSPDAKP